MRRHQRSIQITVKLKYMYVQCMFSLSIQVNLVFPVLFMLVNLFLLVVPIYTSPADTGVGLLICLSAVPVYWVGICWENKPRQFVRIFGECRRCYYTLLKQKCKVSCKRAQFLFYHVHK